MVSSGTESVPPPMPIIELKRPMHEPIIDCPALLGSCLNIDDLPVLNNMFRADKLATNPNRTVNQVPSTLVTNKLPTRTPMRINGAQLFSKRKSTLPLFVCERMELIDVGTIVAREVAVATSMADSGDAPKLWKRKNNTGTMTIPPPTPSNPARIPAKIPVATKLKKVGKFVVMNSMIVIKRGSQMNEPFVLFVSSHEQYY